MSNSVCTLNVDDIINFMDKFKIYSYRVIGPSKNDFIIIYSDEEQDLSFLKNYIVKNYNYEDNNVVTFNNEKKFLDFINKNKENIYGVLLDNSSYFSNDFHYNIMSIKKDIPIVYVDKANLMFELINA